jgi:hypothetical protein
MHPEIARSIAAQRTAELHDLTERERMAAQCRPHARPSAGSRLLARLRPPGARRTAVRPAAAHDAAAGAPPGVFTAGPEAFGVRTYLTAAEARQLAADWADLLTGFADRVGDPSRRPAGAVPFEVVVLGRQVPDLAGATRGRSPGGRPGHAA